MGEGNGSCDKVEHFFFPNEGEYLHFEGLLRNPSLRMDREEEFTEKTKPVTGSLFKRILVNI